jgi:hypothetical protein
MQLAVFFFAPDLQFYHDDWGNIFLRKVYVYQTTRRLISEENNPRHDVHRLNIISTARFGAISEMNYLWSQLQEPGSKL